MRLLLAIPLMALGCSRVTSYPVSSVPEQWGIECRRGQSVCVAEAQRLCRHGFKIVSNSGSASTVYLVQNGPYGTSATPMQDYSGQMIVECVKRTRRVDAGH